MTKDEWHQPPNSDRSILVRVVKTPVTNAEGSVTGVQCIFWDITDEKVLADRYRALVEQSPYAIVVLENGYITQANQAAAELFAFQHYDDLAGRELLAIAREVSGDELSRLSKSSTVSVTTEARIVTHNGRAVDVRLYCSPIPGEPRTQIVFQDVTPTNTLFEEMHHRIRDALSEVSSLLTSQETHGVNEEARRVFEDIRGRIAAIAGVHEILFSQKGRSHVQMKRYLTKLVEAVRDSRGANDGRIIIGLDVDDILLDEAQATSCGLVINELVSNSIVHAFPTGGPGKITVRFLRSAERRIRFTVTDDGCGYDASMAVDKNSMGLTLVNRLVIWSLKGRIDRQSRGGTTTTVEFVEVRR